MLHIIFNVLDMQAPRQLTLDIALAVMVALCWNVQSSQFWSNSANCDSVRDRGVGGSNPLAPTNFSRRKSTKPLEEQAPRARRRQNVG
jgi:hypothetical protein